MRRLATTLLLLLLAMPLFGAGAATRVMTLATGDNATNTMAGGSFEGNDIRGWTAKGATASVVSSDGAVNPFHGGYMLNLAGASTSWCYKTVPAIAAGNILTYRVYIDMTNATCNANQVVNLCSLGVTTTPWAITRIRDNAGAVSIDCAALNDAASLVASATIPWTWSGWTCLTMQVKIATAADAADGYVKLWVNALNSGVSVTSQVINVDNDNLVGASRRFYVGGVWTQITGTGNIDAVEADTAEWIGRYTFTDGIQEAIDAAAGNAYQFSGTHDNLHAAVKLLSGYDLSGDVAATAILKPADSTQSDLVVDAATGDDHVHVADATTFLIGYDVMITTAANSPNHELKTITGIDYDTEVITFDAVTGVLAHDYDADLATTLVAHVYPSVHIGPYPYDGFSTTTTSATCKDLTVSHTGKTIVSRGYWQSQIALLRARTCEVSGCYLIDAAYDALLDDGTGLGSPYNVNLIADNTVDTAARRGIHLGGTLRGDKVCGNTVQDCGMTGIYVCSNVTDTWVYRNVVSGCGKLGATDNDMAGIGRFEDEAAAGEGDNRNVIESCTISDSGTDGIYGYYDAGPTTGNEIINCYIHDNARHGIFMAGMSDLLIQNCLVVDNGGAGVMIGDGTNASVATVANCTVTGSDIGVGEAGAATVTAINSIFYGHTLSYDADPGCTITYSNVGGALTFTGAGNINADPQWNADYTIKHYSAGETASSPCIDTGSTDAASVTVPFGTGSETRKFSMLTTRSDKAPDEGTVDMGFHYIIGLGGHIGVEE